LHLQVQKSERLLRVLMGFTLAYLIVLLLGTDPFAEKLRPYSEQQRRKPRHGTCRSSAYYPSLCNDVQLETISFSSFRSGTERTVLKVPSKNIP